MPLPIEDYALISNCHSSGLVGINGSIDWLTLPCFDSSACFAALLGNEENGHWQICPEDKFRVQRKYVDETVVLETTFETDSGKCILTDCMIMDNEHPTLIRRVHGIEGEVNLKLKLYIRFDYGSIIPWVRRNEHHNGIHAVALFGQQLN